jgi:hypothetical protein
MTLARTPTPNTTCFVDQPHAFGFDFDTLRTPSFDYFVFPQQLLLVAAPILLNVRRNGPENLCLTSFALLLL